MNAARRLPATPFVLAIVVAVTVVLSAPFVGQVRDWIRTTFPGHFILVVGIMGGVVLLAACVGAVRCIRDRKAARYGLILVALAIAAGYSSFAAGPNPESNVVERFHFLEYGLIAFLFYRAWRPLGDLSIVLLPVLAGLIVGTAEEWLQWFIPRRVGEIADIFLNLVAIGCGLLFSIAVLPPDSFSPRLQRPSMPRVARMAAAAGLALAVFVHVLHLGYRIADAEVGSFVSRYAGDRLLAMQAEKTAAWKINPPPLVLVRVSREDQYLSEGIEHVMHRNELWTAGDVAGAWAENRILEKYFAPVLDTPTYAGKSGHRWPPEQRADAEVRAKPTADYVSDAYPYRILTWHKGVFWSVAGILLALLVVTARGYRSVG